MKLITNLDYVSIGAVIPLSATGGTAPYTYSKVSGVGTVSSGNFSSNEDGVAFVKVTDATGAFDIHQINVLSPIQLVCQVIKNYMDLEDDQVWLYNQKVRIPNTTKMVVSVAIMGIKTFGVRSSVNSSGIEESTSFHQAELQIDIMSRDTEALDRVEELSMALNSQYSQSIQELNSIKIGQVTSAVPVGGVDGSAILYRFAVRTNLLYSKKKNRSVEYYDELQGFELATDE